MTLRYVGSGPYCYANSLAMVLGPGAPDPSLIEVLTGSPFGLQLHEGRTPFFDPLGWDPGIGLDAAIDLLGWTCERAGGGSATEAGERLRRAVRTGPALVGPVEMGLLLHQPGAGTAIGADHFVVVIGLDGESVRFHDPHGHPFATLPLDDFLAAWRTDSIGYPAEPFTMRTGFRSVRRVDPLAALRGSLDAAGRWLAARSTEAATPGSPAEAAERLADLIEAGPQPWQREHLVHFAVRVGARRLADASTWLAQIGQTAAAGIADRQARLVGGLQHPLVTGDHASAAGMLRSLAPTYEQMARALAEAND